MELAGGQGVHTHGKAFSTSAGQCNERWRARPCNATQPPSLHLVLVRERRRPVGCQGTFPTGRPAIFPLSLWFLHWAPSHILSLHGFCTGHSRKAPMPSALHRMQTGGKLPCIPFKPSEGEPILCQKSEAALFAPFLPFLGLLLLLSGPDCFFSQLC